MASSRLSEQAFPRRQHASSVSSSASTPSPATPRRIILTIPPLRLKSTNSLASPAHTPGQDVGSTSTSSPRAGVKKVPKIKLKPRQSIVEKDDMVVDSPQDLPPPSPPSRRASLPPPLPPPLLPQKVKMPRPIKLKPLKEVLSKLIVQIKKKDAYAFFLQPVDMTLVSGYSDVVKTPMDFGTMTEKVEKGKYRSLEEFKDDFILVITNAKAFNPPSTMYHTEAARIEAYGLDHIKRASAQVIEYETDWTIDVLTDGDPIASTSALQLNETLDKNVPLIKMEDETGNHQGRSPSILSSVPGASTPIEKTRRAPRTKKVPIVTESWEDYGHLPGYKDGLSAFPAWSDMANLMLDLKLRGKRFRTKKERIRREKEGPPFATDGSLDYTELEHPFTILRQIVPDPPSLPQLVPLFIAQPESSEPAEGTPVLKEASQPPEEKQDDLNQLVRGPVAILPDALSSILSDVEKAVNVNPPTASNSVGKRKLRHWTIVRNPPRGFRSRENDDVDESTLAGQQTKRRRTGEASDYGAFAALMGTVAAESGIKTDNFGDAFSTEEKFLDRVRTSLSTRHTLPVKSSPHEMDVDEEDQLGKACVIEAHDYTRDVVYGGVDGFAYIRSLAEFVGDKDSGSDMNDEATLAPGRLDMPLAHWVRRHIVDPLTNGQHSLLRTAAQATSDPNALVSDELRAYLDMADEDKTTMRDVLKVLSELTDSQTQIDIAPLLRAPHELFAAESEWAGAEYKGEQRVASSESKETTTLKEDATCPPSGNGDANGVQDARTDGTSVTQRLTETTDAIQHRSRTIGDTTEMINYALSSGADAILELDGRAKIIGKGKGKEDAPETEEDALLRRTRLNLIAIAKRAPIEKIAQLPPDLVPPHIRHIVPTLSS